MKKLIILLVTTVSLTIFGQQQSHYTQFFFNPALYNPAAIGTQDLIDIDLGFRKQWVGIANSPLTFTLTAHAPIKMKKKDKRPRASFNPDAMQFFKNPEVKTGRIKHAIGGKLLNDQWGAFGKTSLFLNYAFHVPLSKTVNMSFGVGAGWSNYRFDQDKAVTLDPNDPTYIEFLGPGTNQNIFDLQAGLWIYHKDFFVGLSATNLVMNKVHFGTTKTDNRLAIHSYFTAGYIWRATEKFSVSPSVIVKYMYPAPVSFDVALKFEYNDFVWGAVGYRYDDAIALMAGFNFGKHFQLSYSYDFSISPIRISSQGSHEVTLGILIGGKKEESDEEKKELDENP